MKANVSHIFGTDAKVKMMRLFIFNPTLSFDANHVISRIKESPRVVRRELSILQKSGLVKKRGGQAAKAKKKRGKAKLGPSRKITYTLNTDYPYLHALSDFLVDAVPYTEKEISKKLSRVGTSVKLILLAGVFTHDPESRVDLLIVGDHLKKGSLMKAISEIESELGKEIRYAAFETADFKYRMSMYDKLIRDILDFPHIKILNKIGLEAAPKSHFLSTAEEIEIK